MTLYSLGKKPLVFILSVTFVILQYQNCSSVTGQSFDNNKAFANETGWAGQEEQRVEVIDPVSVGAISFPQNKVSVAGDSLVLTGVCEQDGSMIGWKLYRDDDALIGRGLALCELGSFEITVVNQPWQEFCGEESVMRLTAALGTRASAEVEIFVPCL